MPNYIHRTTKQLLISRSTADLTEPEANYIKDPPNLAAIRFVSSIYWVITGDLISLMDQAARDVVVAAAEVVRLDGVADELDRVQTIIRAFAEVVLDEINNHALKTNEILDAIDGANNLSQVKSAVAAIADLPPRTLSQLKTAVRSKL